MAYGLDDQPLMGRVRKRPRIRAVPENIARIVWRLQGRRQGIDITLVVPSSSHPARQSSSDRMEDYRDQLRAVAEQHGCMFADVTFH